jgi:hypothetical protein
MARHCKEHSKAKYRANFPTANKTADSGYGKFPVRISVDTAAFTLKQLYLLKILVICLSPPHRPQWTLSTPFLNNARMQAISKCSHHAHKKANDAASFTERITNGSGNCLNILNFKNCLLGFYAV